MQGSGASYTWWWHSSVAPWLWPPQLPLPAAGSGPQQLPGGGGGGGGGGDTADIRLRLLLLHLHAPPARPPPNTLPAALQQP